MSRLLGNKTRRDKLYPDRGPEGEGKQAFAAGLPITANRYGFETSNDKGKSHAWARGWRRAAAAARK